MHQTIDIAADIAAEVGRLFDASSRARDTAPRAIVLLGDAASGKTTLRHEDYAHGYVNIDAADLFHRLGGDAGSEPFPGRFEAEMEQIGSAAARRAVAERRHMVVEVTGDSEDALLPLLAALRQAGYDTEIVPVERATDSTRPPPAARRNTLPARLAQPLHLRWLIDACRDYSAGR